MDIHLDGAEITIIKALGLSGGTVSGPDMVSRASGLGEAEILDSVKGLIDMGYVSCDKSSLSSMEDVLETDFRVNSGYIKDLKEALNPKPQDKKKRRVRRE